MLLYDLGFTQLVGGWGCLGGRGGRINTASRYLGTVFSVKPILYFTDEGKIDALERVRTSKKALQRLLELAEEHAGGRPVHVGPGTIGIALYTA